MISRPEALANALEACLEENRAAAH
jgi:hypothetical protein